jgi:hypothetical protein
VSRMFRGSGVIAAGIGSLSLLAHIAGGAHWVVHIDGAFWVGAIGFALIGLSIAMEERL